MGFLVFDIETLDIESTAVCLSAGMVYVEPEKYIESDKPDDIYIDMLRDSVFVKFDAKEQCEKKRTISKSTLDWWTKQGEVQRKTSFGPSDADVSASIGLEKIREFYISKPKNIPVWTRGALDQMVFESLGRTYNAPDIISHWAFRDIRTALDIIYSDTAKRGYVDVENFNRDLVNKHDPVHDCCYDALQLIRGKR